MVVDQLRFFRRAQSEKDRQINIVGNNGVIIKNKGDIHYVDCNVTGSNDGTSKDPNFQLKILFDRCLFAVVEKLVCGGVPF